MLKRALRVAIGLSALALTASGAVASGSAARDYPERARAAAREIELSGDQSAALRSIACVLAHHDPRSALDIVGSMRRPSDAARGLAAAAENLAGSDPAAAEEAAATAGRLLLRIASRDQRMLEQRLLLREVAVLGDGALPAVSELPPEEGRLAILLGRAASDPAGVPELLESWEATGVVADRALAAAAPRLVSKDPDKAIELAASIGSARVREGAFRAIAESLPPEEAAGVAQRAGDGVVRSGILASAAARGATSDVESALLWVAEVAVARDSALAEVAVAVAESDRAGGLVLASGLPKLARRWVVGRVAVEAARSEPAEAEALLAEIGWHPEAVRLAVARMAVADAERAVRLAEDHLAGESRDAALAGIAAKLAVSDPARAADLVWRIDAPRWRASAVSALAPLLARDDCDAATSLIGLVSDGDRACRLRAEVAAAVAARHPETASRLLGSLPPSDYRSEAALKAAGAILSAGGTTESALEVAMIGLERDLALRWLVPSVARSRAGSPLNLAEDIRSGYLQAMSLVDAARAVLGAGSKPRQAPERARQVRPIVEWEGV